MMHSPKRTRSQTTTSTSGEADVLRILMQEIQELREERRRDGERQQAEVQRLELRLTQLSQTSLREASAGEGLSHSDEQENRGVDLKLRPDTFDGSGRFKEYLVQFNLIARANGWDNSTKVVVLASCLRGRARELLESCSETEELSFEGLLIKLQLRFGESSDIQNSYTQFTNRKQRNGEELAALGADLERLVRLAYPDCPQEVRERIACSQFISAISNNFIRQTLQLEGISSLRKAVERARLIEQIRGFEFKKEERGNQYNGSSWAAGNNFGKNFSQENNWKGREFGRDQKFNFSRENEGRNRKPFVKRFGGSKEEDFRKKSVEKEKFVKKRKECWQCGSENHFRAECPSLTNAKKGN